MGLSQQELAHKANVARSAVERIERGFLVYEPTIRQVAAALGLLVGDISHPDEQARSRDQPDTGSNDDRRARHGSSIRWLNHPLIFSLVISMQ